MVGPRIEMYPRRMALRRVELEGEPREREMYVAKAASFRLKIGGVVGCPPGQGTTPVVP